MRLRALRLAALAALLVGAVAWSAALIWSSASVRSQGSWPIGGGLIGFGWTAQPTFVWRGGSGPVASPEAAARLALHTVQARGWAWLTVDKVHVFPAFYEVELDDRDGFKGPDLYVNRFNGAVGPEMGPNIIWDTRYGRGRDCRSELNEVDAAEPAAVSTALRLGQGERHHGYWQFDLMRGNAVVNQVDVNNCTRNVVSEQTWQADMEWTTMSHAQMKAEGKGSRSAAAAAWPPFLTKFRARSTSPEPPVPTLISGA